MPTEPVVSTSAVRKPQHGRVRHLAFVGVEHGRLDPLHLAAGADRAHAQCHRNERHGPHQLDGDARHEVGRTGIEGLAHVCEQRARRTAVHRTRIPGPTRELRRDVAIAVTLEQRAERLDRVFAHERGA